MKKKGLFDKVLWFGRKDRFDIDFVEMLLPRRQVSHKARYRSGVFHSEKCDRDIQYESGLELDFIRHLEGSPDVIFFWEQPIAIPYWRGKLKAKTYPDFGIYLKSRHFVLAEIKSLSDMLDHRVQAKAEGVMDFCSSHGFGYLLTDGKHTPEHLLKGAINRKLERELVKALAVNPIREPEYRDIKLRTGATPAQLYRAIIRLGLKYSSYRFKIQRGGPDSLFRQVFFGKKNYDELNDEQIKSFIGFSRAPNATQ